MMAQGSGRVSGLSSIKFHSGAKKSGTGLINLAKPATQTFTTQHSSRLFFRLILTQKVLDYMHRTSSLLHFENYT
jgi:hypothetical protein